MLHVHGRKHPQSPNPSAHRCAQNPVKPLFLKTSGSRCAQVFRQPVAGSCIPALQWRIHSGCARAINLVALIPANSILVVLPSSLTEPFPVRAE